MDVKLAKGLGRDGVGAVVILFQFFVPAQRGGFREIEGPKLTRRIIAAATDEARPRFFDGAGIHGQDKAKEMAPERDRFHRF